MSFIIPFGRDGVKNALLEKWVISWTITTVYVHCTVSTTTDLDCDITGSDVTSINY
jgi:hypothetical protein